MQHFYKVTRAKTILRQEKTKEKFDQYVPKKHVFKIADKVYAEESQILNNPQNNFNGSSKIFQNSTTLLIPTTYQRSKITFNRLKCYHE